MTKKGLAIYGKRDTKRAKRSRSRAQCNQRSCRTSCTRRVGTGHVDELLESEKEGRRMNLSMEVYSKKG